MVFKQLGICATVLVALAAVEAGCSRSADGPGGIEGAAGPIGATQQAIQNGADDTGHPFALGLCGGNRGACSGICSAALITPNLVVTARHCVSQCPEIIECDVTPPLTFGGAKHGGNFWVTTHHEMIGQNSIGWHKVDKILVPDDDKICGQDIALLILEEPIADTEAKPIIPGIQYGMGDPRYKHEFTAIGYGNTSPAGGTAGTRRIRKRMPVRCIPGDAEIPCPSQIHENEFIGGDGTCKGDSGSSAYEQSSFDFAGALKAVSFGVLSRGGDSTDGTLCKSSLYTRLDKHRDLILQAADEASAGWTLYPKPSPDWTIYVPPPPDAGAPEGGPAKPVILGTGESCTSDDECATSLCAGDDGAKICAEFCDETVTPTTCATGFTCKGGACLPDAVAAPAPPEGPAITTVTEEGCAVGHAGPIGRESRGSSGWMAVGLALGLAARLRARRARPDPANGRAREKRGEGARHRTE